MKSKKILSWSVGTVICLLLLVGGCAQTATMALKFTPEDSTTYKITTQTEDSIKFEGTSLKGPEFKDSRNHKAIEITFTRQIQSVDDKGNAVAKITIEDLKYLAIYKDELLLDFDSSREKDQNSTMAKLIGKTYTMKITPTGQVSKVIDVSRALDLVRAGSAVDKAAVRLLSPDAIKERHTILPLPAADKNQLRTGGSWSSIKVFSFGMMGSKSYEKIYTLKEIKDTDGQRIAIVEMDAIPTSEMAEQLHKQLPSGILTKMFDNPIDTYTGCLKLDLTSGKVEKYLEELQSEWVIVDPEAEQQGDEEPAAVRMKATRLYKLKKID